MVWGTALYFALRSYRDARKDIDDFCGSRKSQKRAASCPGTAAAKAELVCRPVLSQLGAIKEGCVLLSLALGMLMMGMEMGAGGGDPRQGLAMACYRIGFLLIPVLVSIGLECRILNRQSEVEQKILAAEMGLEGDDGRE